MIQGDIDLTEKLDFYRSKPQTEKGTSIVPWKGKDQKDLVSTKNGRIYGSWGPWTISNTVYFEPTTTIVNNTYTYNIDNNLIYYDFESNTIQPTSTTINYSISDSQLTHYLSYTNSWTDTSWTDITNSETTNSSTDSYYTITLDTLNCNKPLDDDPIKSRFCHSKYNRQKNPIEKCACCGKRVLLKCRCYKKSKENDQYDMRKLFSRKHERYNYKVESEYYQDELKYLFTNNLCFLSFRNRIGKASERWLDPRHIMKHKHRRIPWLDKLQERIYEDYMKDLYEEQDYSRYLTDMAWIHIDHSIVDNTIM